MRNRKKSKFLNYNNYRSLYESIIPNEVISALNDWKNNYSNDNYVLIGGLALSYYLKPRYTEDIDLIFLLYDDIPNSVYGFKRNREHSFQHNKTHVEVEILTPEHINTDPILFDKIFEHSIMSDGIRVSSPVGLIALKLNRFNNKDISDIKELYNYCLLHDINIDLSDYNVLDENIEKYNNLKFDDKIHESQSTMDIHGYLKEEFIEFKFGNKYIYIFESEYGEPRFYYSNSIEKRIMDYTDFKFGISLIDKNIKVLESSTDSLYIKEYEDLTKYINENRDELVKGWNTLNPKRKIL